MSNTFYPLGKLPADHLAGLLSGYQANDPRLVLGGQVGEDAAIIDMGDRYLAAKSDPITFATDKIGWYAVNVNANDIACMGATPKWFLATILLPEAKTTPDLAKGIFGQIVDACSELGITLAGGHTEITFGLDRPIVAGQMLGEVAKDKLVLTRNARPGDDLLLTKSIAIEATAIIATEKRHLLQEVLSPAKLDRLGNYLRDPGISIVPEARIAVEMGGVHAMHDPTEGGIATGLWELAQAANVGLEIFADALPINSDCRMLCERFDLDPLGVIASGSLLMAVDVDISKSLREALRQNNIEASIIGRVTEADFGVQLVGPGSNHTLPTFARDEITKLFE